MWINGSPLLFFDSSGYLDQGWKSVEGALALIWPSNGAAEGEVAGAAKSFEAAAA